MSENQVMRVDQRGSIAPQAICAVAGYDVVASRDGAAVSVKSVIGCVVGNGVVPYLGSRSGIRHPGPALVLGDHIVPDRSRLGQVRIHPPVPITQGLAALQA